MSGDACKARGRLRVEREERVQGGVGVVGPGLRVPRHQRFQDLGAAG